MAETVKGRMPVRLTLLPGKRGTLGLLRKYGDSLVCVRYRYDEKMRRRYKTVELIVDEVEWFRRQERGMINKVVKLRILYEERELREAIKRSGGFWDRELRVWKLRYGEVLRLGLEARVTE